MEQRQPTFDQQVQVNAAKIRGAYLDMSADIEFLLSDIICVCLIREAKDRNYIKEVLLGNVMLKHKIEATERALKIYNKDYYTIAEPYIIEFKKFAKMRNKLSHVRIVGDNREKNLDMLFFVTFEDGERVETPHYYSNMVRQLQVYAKAVNELGEKLIPVLYTERYKSRYSNILLFPSNRSIAYWHNYFQLPQ